MLSLVLYPVLVFGLSLLAALRAEPLQRRAVAYDDPRITGGSMLDSSAGLGEPLNVRTVTIRLIVVLP